MRGLLPLKGFSFIAKVATCFRCFDSSKQEKNQKKKMLRKRAQVTVSVHIINRRLIWNTFVGCGQTILENK